MGRRMGCSYWLVAELADLASADTEFAQLVRAAEVLVRPLGLVDTIAWAAVAAAVGMAAGMVTLLD